MSGFIILPPDDKGYPGMTKLPLDGTREMVALGVGSQVEAVLLAARLAKK